MTETFETIPARKTMNVLVTPETNSDLAKLKARLELRTKNDAIRYLLDKEPQN